MLIVKDKHRHGGESAHQKGLSKNSATNAQDTSTISIVKTLTNIVGKPRINRQAR